MTHSKHGHYCSVRAFAVNPARRQTFVNRMQYWPANVTKRSDMQGRSTLEILEANKNFELQP